MYPPEVGIEGEDAQAGANEHGVITGIQDGLLLGSSPLGQRLPGSEKLPVELLHQIRTCCVVSWTEIYVYYQLLIVPTRQYNELKHCVLFDTALPVFQVCRCSRG